MSQSAAMEAEVREVLERYTQALRNKDLDALRSCYADDVRVFDLGMQLEGYEQLRALWESCLPYFPNPIGTERKDVQLSVSSGLAVVSFYSRLTGMETDHPSAKSWLRTTVCLKKIGEDWKIIHDHISLPVDCEAEEPTYLLDE